VHQFIWHPITVALGWHQLYGCWPTWPELVCIGLHDIGYWGKPNIDGEEGDTHPEYGAGLAHWLLEPTYWEVLGETDDQSSGWSVLKQKTYWLEFCLFHSRHYAAKYGKEPSKLCWADKLSCAYDPWWFYLTRSWLTGEIHEQRKMWADEGRIPITATHKEWYLWAQQRSINIGLSQGKVNYKLHRSPGSPEDES
jgi:hypothetical protein